MQMHHLDRSTALRYTTVLAIVLVIGGLFLWREVLSGSAQEAEELGLLDGRQAVVGEPAPDFALRDPEGDVHRLSDYRGRIVVLNFWATWCPPCREEMPVFQDLWEQRGGPGGDLVVLAVNAETTPITPRAVADFGEEFALTFPLPMDGDPVAERYGLRGRPGTFFIDRDGVLRRAVLGPVFGDLLPEGIAAAEAGGD